jgi:serine/threonine-protein kinase
VSGESARVSLSILGHLGVIDTRGREVLSVLRQPKRLALLAYLARAGRDRYRQRDTLVTLFWPDSDQERARAALRQALSWLRRELGVAVLNSRGEEEIGINASALICDAVEFDAAIATGDLERALQLYRGELLEGVFVSGAAPEFEQWLDDERRVLRVAATRAAMSLAEREAANGRAAVAADWARRATSLSPNDEAIHRRLMELLIASGDRAGAVETFETFRGRLANDYGTDPAPETERLITRIRTTRGPQTSRDRPARVDVTLREPVIARPRYRIARPLMLVIVVALVAVASGVSALMGGRSGAERPPGPGSVASPRRPPGSLAPPVTANPAAYNLLLRAEYYSQWRSPAGFRQALGLVNKAIELDPLYADAHGLLAETYQAFAWYGLMPANEAFLKSEAEALRAVALDSASALGHAMLASNLSFFRYRWEEGEREFRLALALDSLNAQVRNFYSIHLRALGRFDEALRQMRRAQDLDQMYRHYHWASGYILACAERDDSAIVEFRRAVDFDSTYSRARLDLAEALFRLGRFDDGLRELRRTFEITGDSAKVAAIATARGEGGYRAARRRLAEIDLARLRHREARDEAVAAIDYGKAFLATGKRDSAIIALELAFNVRDPRLVYLVCPEFTEIRDETRVHAILRGMNLQ